MAWKNERFVLPKIAASALAECIVVTPDTSTDDQVYTAGSANVDAIGVTIATVPTYGYSVGIQTEGVAKVLVAASTGAGARVSVASANGGVGPIVYPAAAPSGAAAARSYSIGVLQEARAAGEYGSVYLDPREVV